MRFLRAARLLAMWWCVAVNLHGQQRPAPPSVLSFEGSLVDATGALFGGGQSVSLPMILRIYDSDVGGRVLWSEQQRVSVVRGSFAVVLGEGSAFASEPRPELPAVFVSSTASDRFVEVTVRGVGTGGSDVTVTPRTRLAAGAYSMLATHARMAQSLVDSAGRSVVTASGGRVGINTANPSATLDVSGIMMASELESSGSFAVSGAATAVGYSGLGMAPVGSIIMWTGSTPPEGWVLCDGSEVNGVRTPDLRGRFVISTGDGIGLSSRALNAVGGAEAVALTVAQIPGHNHRVSVASQEAALAISTGSHGYRVAMSGNPLMETSQALLVGQLPNRYLNQMYTEWSDYHRHWYDIPAFESAVSGAGRPHSTMPPYHVLAFIMRVR